jgi:hypothetical protein
MAWRYIQRDFQAGDIVDPEDWNENVREYLEEVNGTLDRDNLPSAAFAIGEEIPASVVHELSHAVLNAAYTLLDTDTQAYQATGLSKLVNTTSDELFICEASLQFDTADSTAVYDGTNYDDGYIKADVGSLRDWLQYDFTMTVNGYEIASAGPFTVYQKRQPVYLLGCLPVEKGSYTVECFVRLFTDRRGTDEHTWDADAQSLGPRITVGTMIINRRKR